MRLNDPNRPAMPAARESFESISRVCRVAMPQVLLFALVLAWLYWSSVGELVQVWRIDPNYSHGCLVPLVSLSFAWRGWKRIGWPVRNAVDGRAVGFGLAAIAFGLALHLFTRLVTNLLLDVISLVCVLRGMFLVLGGWEVNRAYGFAADFLLFMAPLPFQWYLPIAVAMQQLVSGLSTWMLQVFGVPVFREGYVVHLPGYTMEVGAACSGLRQLAAFVALAAAAAHLSGREWRYKATLLLLSAPIALGANCVRVILTGVILMLAGPEWAEGVYHTLEGLAVMGLGTVFMLGVAWGLGKLCD